MPAVAHAYDHSSCLRTTFTISELAKEFDLTTRAIRFYEDMGLLAPQRGPGGSASTPRATAPG